MSNKMREILLRPVFNENPIALQILGICSALAVTSSLKVTSVMCICLIVVAAVSSMLVSLIRNQIPGSIRIIVQMTVIASVVILVDQVLKAVAYDISKQLSVFVGLIITNCIIMGRLEAFALGNKVWPSFLDAIGNSIGYAWILVVVAFFRELFGSGKILGFQIIPESFYEAGYMNNNMMILPPMALITVALIIWVQRSKNTDLIEEN